MKSRMKKISALILAFVLVAAFASVAFAANTPNSWSQFPQRRKDNTVRSYTALAQCIARAFTGNAIDIDGNFGPATKTAVLAYQERNGLSRDGIVGSNTWSSMQARVVGYYNGNYFGLYRIDYGSTINGHNVTSDYRLERTSSGTWYALDGNTGMWFTATW